ncbi:thrombomodulin-like [Cololabis saira]|uniref:thrombomodulin-like n=1 Tax=Cololabis saira TaxID=129043 RepID=UPI002AD556E8|nr:thrombomodulin-like [Cololabis saira]
MNNVTLLLVWVFLCVGKAGGIAPESGYCIGNECFTVFRDASSSFRNAQRQCTDAGGHLMTVRSSVSHDVLQILLGNLTGSFWIGLQLLSGCPDDSAGLKGFQWVTKDAESDFTNWPLSFNSSCSSGRCVSVSKEDDFKWIQAQCEGRAAGFLCEHSFSDPCKGLAVAPGESVSYETPLGFTAEDLLFAPPGSVATRLPSETTSICFSQRWLRAPWSCEINEGGCEYQCAVDPSSKAPSCYCPPGQTVNPANNVSCEKEQDADDPCLLLRCQQVCYKDGDAHACACEHGYQLAEDGRSCVDFNDCADPRQCPGENFRCVNTPGGFQCVCQAGYRLKAGTCVDVDECASAPCEHICDNTPGGYACSCYEGYAVDAQSSDKCALFCGREECPAVCDPNDPSQCFCPHGFVQDVRDSGSFCVDMDECAYSYCDQSCENTYGGYTCSCSPGFTLVEIYKCIKNDDEDGDGDGGSGMTRAPDVLGTTRAPAPAPTRRPSAVSAGGLVGIIVCTVFFVVLLVFVAHLVFTRRRKQEHQVA